MPWTVIAIHRCPGRHVVATWMLSGKTQQPNMEKNWRCFFLFAQQKKGKHRKMHLARSQVQQCFFWKGCKRTLPPSNDICVCKVKKLIEYRADPLLEPGLSSLINGWFWGMVQIQQCLKYPVSCQHPKDINFKRRSRSRGQILLFKLYLATF